MISMLQIWYIHSHDMEILLENLMPAATLPEDRTWTVQLSAFAKIWCLSAQHWRPRTGTNIKTKTPSKMKSNNPWLDEIRDTRLGVKLNRICACWFEDLHTIVRTQEEEVKYIAREDFWQSTGAYAEICSRLMRESGSTEAHCRFLQRLRNFIFDTEDETGSLVFCLMAWM